MGCDIHTAVEVKRSQDAALQVRGDKWVYISEPMFPGWKEGTFTKEPFDDRDYGLFGFLADVRNYSAVPPLSPPRGLPDDVSDEVREMSDWQGGYHSHSWFTLKELLDFDYSQSSEDRRYTDEKGNGGATAEPGKGETTTYREFFSETFFRDLEILNQCFGEKPEDVRVVFWFDN